MSDEGTQFIHLSESYRYDDEYVTKIPIDYHKDMGGAVLVHSPDGSYRMFSKEEVRSIDEMTPPGGDADE